jgi:hypothetical protein
MAMTMTIERGDPDEMRSAAEGSPTKPITNQGKLQARGEAQMFQA